MNGLRRWCSFALKLEQRFRGDDALVMAAALSYTSLLSLVPLLAVGLALLAAFPAFEGARIQIQLLLVQNLAPEVGQQVRQVIAGFIGNAGNLTAIGVVGLVVTALLLLVNIEDSLNRIFRVTRPRSLFSRLIIYWTMVTLGPLLLGASLSITDWLFGGVSDDSTLSTVLDILSTLFHFVMLVALLTLLYATMPHRVVPLRIAAIGATMGGVAIGLLRFGFHLYVADMKAYQSLYGALAAVPIMLLWMYLLWATVLAGAELTAFLIERRDGGVTPSPPSS